MYCYSIQYLTNQNHNKVLTLIFHNLEYDMFDIVITEHVLNV